MYIAGGFVRVRVCEEIKYVSLQELGNRKEERDIAVLPKPYI